MAWEPFVVGFDIHGNEQDPKTNAAFFDFVSQWKPKHRIIGGDLWDFAALRKGASDSEKRISTKDDFDAGMRWIDAFKPTAFVEGNHDVRIRKLAEKGTGALQDFAKERVEDIRRKLDKLHCAWRPYNNKENVYEVGRLRVVHGFGSGLPALQRMGVAYGSVLQGHEHIVYTMPIGRYDSVSVVRVCGCLCRLNLEYAETGFASLRWQHGWPYGYVNSKTGNYVVFQAEEVDGKWFYPEKVRGI